MTETIVSETIVSETNVSDAGKIVFDTNWIINFVKGKVDEASFLGTTRHISVITRIELYGYPGISPKERADITRFLLGVAVAPLDDEVEQQAIEVRRKYCRKTADAVITATAIVLGATLVSGDGHLTKKKIPGLPVIFEPSPPAKASWRSVFMKYRPFWTALGCFIISTLVLAILFILK
ncbi:hypothetical protein AGMMS49944_28180 [Spirochaetia bacterium]|nr:hypothetical protein AGMMS49944_28180 [Spirochaetia bacterium]